MKESQGIEWKSKWRDEYLKWICGFANAEGGRLEIGKDDEGKVVGVRDAERLMEELPNKIRDLLGIITSRMPAISFQGTSGYSCFISPETRLVASPMISSWRTTASCTRVDS